MDFKELIKFGLEESSEPIIKNPVLRNAMAGGGTPQLVQPSVDGLRPGYSGTSELNKATKYFTDGEFTKFDDIKGFKSDDPNYKKYKKMRDQIRQNIKYHGGKFVEPRTTHLVNQKTIDLENFLKNKKSIKQSVLIKKLEDLGYDNPKKYVNTVAFKNPDLEVIRDVKRIIPERESKIYSKKELNKATAGEHKKDSKRITKSTYDSLPSEEKALIRSKLLQHGGEYLGPYRQIKDPLPVDVQKEIKFKFAGDYKGTWDFDNFKYGIEGGRDKNSRLYDSIRSHVNEPKQWRYAGAQLNTPEGWMMAQMDRAYRQGNKNYKPIYRTIGGTKKIVGFIDNTEAGGGKKYISAKEFIKGSDADGVLFSDPKKGHVDYANNKKFNNIAQKVHGSPSKVITDILGKGGVEMFTESGKAKVQLKHVLGYLIDTKGLDKTTGGIVRHHKGGAFGNPTQDFQILNKVINSRITGIEDRIRADNILPEDIAKLKKWGASVSHKGVTYGGGPKTALGGLKEIENLILKGSKDVELYGKKIKGIEQWKKQDFNKFKNYLIKLGCGMYAGGRVGFKVGSGKCVNRAVAKLKSGKLNASEKKIVDAMGDGLKKGGMPKKFWTTALKGEGYFALADFANNLTKGQSLDKSFSNAIKTATFGLADFKGNERDLLKYAEERGLDTEAVKQWMDYGKTYGKYEKAYDDVEEREKIVEASGGEEEFWKNFEPNVIANPSGNILGTENLWGAEDRIKKYDKQLTEKEKQESIYSGKGSKDFNEAIEGVIAKEWNKTAGTPFDRGFRKMVGMKGDEGLLWGILGNLTREGIEKLGLGEHEALKGFKPQTVMNYHPVYGYKEDIKKIIREGDSPMEDMLMFMEKYYPSSALLEEAMRGKEAGNLQASEGYDQTGWGLMKRPQQVDMGTYAYDPNLGYNYAGGGIAGIRRPSAIPPESGPTPYGLPSMLNRVKRV